LKAYDLNSDRILRTFDWLCKIKLTLIALSRCFLSRSSGFFPNQLIDPPESRLAMLGVINRPMRLDTLVMAKGALTLADLVERISKACGTLIVSDA
jgi:hypothetical protein